MELGNVIDLAKGLAWNAVTIKVTLLVLLLVFWVELVRMNSLQRMNKPESEGAVRAITDQRAGPICPGTMHCLCQHQTAFVLSSHDVRPPTPTGNPVASPITSSQRQFISMGVPSTSVAANASFVDGSKVCFWRSSRFPGTESCSPQRF